MPCSHLALPSAFEKVKRFSQIPLGEHRAHSRDSECIDDTTRRTLVGKCVWKTRPICECEIWKRERENGGRALQAVYTCEQK